jgi:hypothetical protein
LRNSTVHPTLEVNTQMEGVTRKWVGVTAGYFYDTLPMRYASVGYTSMGFTSMGYMYFYRALKFVSINCTVVRNT